MQKRKLLPWIAFLIFSGGILFGFRFELINRIQQHILKSIGFETGISNHSFSNADSLHGQHRIYSLSGIGRIWPHRVNSLKRFKYLYHQFPGFESDIRFSESDHKLYIAHDPDEINSLTFTNYLLTDPEHKLFWLDVKNLGDSNINSFCIALQHLDNEFSLRNRIIIESSDTVALSRLTELGYLVSFYLPPVNRADSVACKKYVDGIAGFLKNHSIIISQDIGMHDFMTQHFPNQKQLVWDLRFWNSVNNHLLSKHCNDTSLLICLINIKSPGYM
jgi:hypothetical protein